MLRSSVTNCLIKLQLMRYQRREESVQVEKGTLIVSKELEMLHVREKRQK